MFQSYPNPPLFSHPWGFFPFGGVSFENVEIRCAPHTLILSRVICSVYRQLRSVLPRRRSYSRNQSAVGAAKWPWLRAFHIDRRGKPSPGEADITGSVTLYSSTPGAVCEPSFAPGPQTNVSIVTRCNPVGLPS